MTNTRSPIILAVLAVAGTTFALLQSIVVPALPQIEHALHAGPTAGAWILSANLLSTAVLTPILGRLGDMRGKERVLLGVMGALGAGTLICALAPSLPVMLAGRALQGAGGAVYPLAFGIIRDELPRERVPGAIGLVSSLLGIGAGLGLVIPGAIVSALNYHWLFWLPLGVIAATTLLIARCIPASPVRTPAPVNLVSAVLMAAGLSAVLVAVSEAASWGWGSPRTLAVLAAGALAVASWIRRELASDSPLVDMRMMAIRGVWTANLAAFLLGVGMYASIALVPALVESPHPGGFGGSVTLAGLFMFPTAAVQLIVGPLTGRIERRIGPRAQLLAGMTCALTSYVMLTGAHRTSAEVLSATVILGLGLGLGLGALANLVVQSVRQEQTGVGTAMNTVMRTLGGAFGAQVTASCLAGPGGFTLAFGICAVALLAGVLSAAAVPGAARPLVWRRVAWSR
jgi:MFS family permease